MTEEEKRKAITASLNIIHDDMDESDFIQKLNEKCAELDCKTNFANLEHLAKYITSAECFLRAWRDG